MTNEEQFAHPTSWSLDGQKIEIFDVVPEHPKSEVPVVIVQGWLATPLVWKENILLMAKEGRRIIAINAPHGIAAKPVQGFPDAEVRKAAALIKALEEKGIARCDAVAHSEGAIAVTIAATLYPERFRNIICIDPAGMIGKADVPRLAHDFLDDVINSQAARLPQDPELLRPMLRSMVEYAKSFAQDPVQSTKEIQAISGMEIQQLLRALKDKGIGIAVIHAVDDKAFPIEKIHDMAHSAQVHGFYAESGSHQEVYLKPREYTALIDKVLTTLEKRRA